MNTARLLVIMSAGVNPSTSPPDLSVSSQTRKPGLVQRYVLKSGTDVKLLSLGIRKNINGFGMSYANPSKQLKERTPKNSKGSICVTTHIVCGKTFSQLLTEVRVTLLEKLNNLYA